MVNIETTLVKLPHSDIHTLSISLLSPVQRGLSGSHLQIKVFLTTGSMSIHKDN